MSAGGVAPPPPAQATLSSADLVVLLVRLRWRTLWNGLKRGPRVRGFRFVALIGLVVPLAYVGLFANAFSVLGETGGLVRQEAALALCAAAIALSSFASKVAAGEAVLGLGGEGEFLLARPVSLARLVVARGIGGVATDLFDALLLLPVLLAASLVWGLGAAAVGVGVLISLLVQVAVSALAQAAQILVVHLVPARRRRLIWALLALLAAAAMALVWMVGSTILRSTAEAARLLAPFEGGLRQGPGGLIVAPLRALRGGDALGAAGAVAALAGVSVGALALAAAVARICSRRGWEQAGAPWAEAAPGRPRPNAAPLSLYGKDWRLLLRDRSRLLMVFALPVLFIGIQVFGSAGWAWSTATASRRALCAYSLAAYAATFGPLQHMEAERRAFWMLFSAPTPLGKLLAWKAAFWSSLVGGLAAAIYATLWIASPAGPLGEALGYGALAVGGAVAISWLAVGLAAGAADLSDERKGSLGLGTGYLFMLLAGLFNLAIVQVGLDRGRALLLYVLAAGITWSSGVARARDAFDPPVTTRPLLAPTAGALCAVLLFLGGRAGQALQPMAGAGPARAVQLGWMVLIGLAALVHRLRHRVPAPRWAVFPALALGLGLGTGAGLLGRITIDPAPAAGLTLLSLLAARALVEEIAIRGILQPALAFVDARKGIWIAAAVSALTAWGVSAQPFSLAGFLEASLPAIALGSTGRLSAALVTRAALLLVLGA